ncbi:hypothetical protein MMC29_001050 [Sticta canariensis]|nr:hypothetical protein [Sticta canariensis]
MTSAATTDIASSITQPPSSTIQPDGRDLSLGSGAKVGIIVGAVIVGLLILAGVVYLVRRSKGRRAVLDGPDQSGYVFTGGKAELDSRVWAELESRERAARAPTELDTGNNRAEL